MPFGDGTGPRGLGPLTGRRLGFCAGYPVAGAFNPAGWWGWGVGRGRGWRNRFWATCVPGWAWGGGFCGGPNPATVPGPYAAAPAGGEYEALRAQAQWLEEQLAAVRQRLAELMPPGDAGTKGKEEPGKETE